MTTSSPDRLAEQRAALARVEALEASRAQLHVAAAAARADIAELWADERSGFAEMELAGTALVGQIRAARELTDGTRLTRLFPRLAEQASAGVVFVPTVEAVLLATRRCTEQVQQAVDARLAGLLVGRNVTDVRRLVEHAVLAVEAEIDPELTRRRLDDARQDARVWVSPGADGMTSIGAVIEAVAGRRWALDFEQLVHAQQVLDQREGRTRTLQQVQAEVFAHLPSLVLALARAARDGVLLELTEQAALDPDDVADVEALTETLAAQSVNDVIVDEPAVDGAVASATDGPADDPAADEALAPATHGLDPATGHERDPYDALAADLAALDPTAGIAWTTPNEPTGPDAPEGPLPDAAAAQDAAERDNLIGPWHDSKDLTLQDLLLRCLRMPLSSPTVVNLHLPMATALDLSTAPGHLEGHGALDGRRIRELLPEAQLREVYVDADTGVPLGAGAVARPRPDQATTAELLKRLRPVTLVDDAEPRHDPSAALAAFVKLRDQRCAGPGCSMPASRCDLDHERAFPDGPTAEWNLADRSRRCHGAKHHGWSADRRPDGRTVWVSPTGRTYTSHSPWLAPPRPARPFGVTFHPPPQRVRVEVEI